MLIHTLRFLGDEEDSCVVSFLFRSFLFQSKEFGEWTDLWLWDDKSVCSSSTKEYLVLITINISYLIHNNNAYNSDGTIFDMVWVLAGSLTALKQKWEI